MQRTSVAVAERPRDSRSDTAIAGAGKPAGRVLLDDDGSAALIYEASQRVCQAAQGPVRNADVVEAMQGHLRHERDTAAAEREMIRKGLRYRDRETGELVKHPYRTHGTGADHTELHKPMRPGNRFVHPKRKPYVHVSGRVAKKWTAQ